MGVNDRNAFTQSSNDSNALIQSQNDVQVFGGDAAPDFTHTATDNTWYPDPIAIFGQAVLE